MKRMLVIVFAAVALGSYAQAGYSPQQMQVLMKMQGLKNALIGKDSIALTGLLSNNVTYGHTNGLIQTKAQLIRDVVSGVQDYKSIDPSDMNIRVFEQAAIVTMKSAVKMLFNNNPLEFNMYVTLVWIRQEGEWKLEARQSVKL